MKKNAYISPAVTIAVVSCQHLMTGSLKGTNIDGLGVKDEDAPSDMEGHSRRRRRRRDEWDDEEEEW
jgi:hypothetical protein